MKEIMTSLLIYAVVGILMLNAFMYFQQPRMIFFPIAGLHQVPSDWGLSYEDVTFSTEDSVSLHGWFLPVSGAEQVLLFFHGNAGNISHRRESIEIFQRLGLSVFIIDYRGYGNSDGTPDEEGLYRDARAAWRYLTEEKSVDPENVIIFGRSIGGAVAANLAADVHARGLILESTMSSAREFAREVFRILSRLVVIRYDFNTVQNIQQINYPVLVLHSPDDEIMPFHLGEKVYRSANQPKQFVRMRGDHNNGFYLSQPEYEQAIGDWLGSL
ncbi:MAG: alpha/beta fold hydrolase [Gammaproteobacteria bacterium]|nr:alpha/beta fold hydrolase [Gammaproteobacteria bacterium]